MGRNLKPIIETKRIIILEINSDSKSFFSTGVYVKKF